MTDDQKKRSSSTVRRRLLFDLTFMLLGAFILGLIHHGMRSSTSLWEPPIDPDYQFLDFVNAQQVHSVLGRAGTIVLDARARSAYSDEHLPSSLSLPARTKVTPELMAQLSAATQVIIYCSGPHCRAAEAEALTLYRLGIRRLAVYRGGMAEWRQLGYELDGKKGSSTKRPRTQQIP